MNRFSEFESTTPEVAAGLRHRHALRVALVLFTIAFVAVLLWGGLVARGSLEGAGWVAFLVGVVAFFCDIELLFGACPRCGERFSEPSIANLFFFPSPSAFTGSCATCGVPLSRAG